MKNVINKKENRFMVMILVVAMCGALLTGCGKGSDSTETSYTDKADKKSVVCTIFPEYDWAREIIGGLGDNYELTLLMDDGTDLHNFQPTAADIAKIAACDMFVYVGGESDGWVEDALKEATNPNMQVINLLEVLGTDVKEEEVVEGMQAEEHDHDDHDHGEHDEEETHDHEDEHDHEADEIEYDEHVWLSLKSTCTIVKAMEQAFETIDNEHATAYQEHATAYVNKLEALDQEYEKAVRTATKKTILFGDRFPFRYLVDDYGLDYYAAFVGCSAETEASFETITFLAGKMDQLGLEKIFVIEKSDQKIAKTIVENTTQKNQEILVLNSLQSVTGKDVEAGATYLGIMEENLQVLKQAIQ